MSDDRIRRRSLADRAARLFRRLRCSLSLSGHLYVGDKCVFCPHREAPDER